MWNSSFMSESTSLEVSNEPDVSSSQDMTSKASDPAYVFVDFVLTGDPRSLHSSHVVSLAAEHESASLQFFVMPSSISKEEAERTGFSKKGPELLVNGYPVSKPVYAEREAIAVFSDFIRNIEKQYGSVALVSYEPPWVAHGLKRFFDDPFMQTLPMFDLFLWVNEINRALAQREERRLFHGRTELLYIRRELSGQSILEHLYDAKKRAEACRMVFEFLKENQGVGQIPDSCKVPLESRNY